MPPDTQQPSPERHANTNTKSVQSTARRRGRGVHSRPSIGGSTEHIKWAAFGSAECEDSTCHQPHCMARGEGKCEESPYFNNIPGVNKGGGDNDDVSFNDSLENVCVDHLPFANPPLLSVAGSDGEETAGGGVKRAREGKQSAPTPPLTQRTAINDFKNLTSYSFDTWYDWPAQCGPPSSKYPNGEINGGHDMSTDDKIYRLYNACLRPVGKRVSGWRGGGSGGEQSSSLGDYLGGDEIEPLFGRDHGTLHGLRGYLSNANVDSLSSRPTCYLDTKLLLMPVFMRAHNPGHVFHRHAALNWIRGKVWPSKTSEGNSGGGSSNSVKDFTTAFWLGDPQWSDLSVLGHVQFLGTESGSFFSLFGHTDESILSQVFQSHSSSSSSSSSST